MSIIGNMNSPPSRAFLKNIHVLEAREVDYQKKVKKFSLPAKFAKKDKHRQFGISTNTMQRKRDAIWKINFSRPRNIAFF